MRVRLSRSRSSRPSRTNSMRWLVPLAQKRRALLPALVRRRLQPCWVGREQRVRQVQLAVALLPLEESLQALLLLLPLLRERVRGWQQAGRVRRPVGLPYWRCLPPMACSSRRSSGRSSKRLPAGRRAPQEARPRQPRRALSSRTVVASSRGSGAVPFGGCRRTRGTELLWWRGEELRERQGRGARRLAAP